jgi:hypothetical protein
MTQDYNFDRMIEVAEQNVEIFKAEYHKALKRLDDVYDMKKQADRKAREREAAVEIAKQIEVEVIDDDDKDRSDY